MLSASIVCQALGLVRSLIVPKILTPMDYGLWRGVALVLDLGVHSHFGLLHVLNRELPILLVRDEHDRAARLRSNTFWSAMGLASLVAIGVVIASFTSLGARSEVRIAMWIAAGAVLLQQLYSYHSMILRATMQFRTVAARNVLNAAATLLFACVLAYLWGVPGMALGLTLAFGATVLFLGGKSPIPALDVDGTEVRAILRRGVVFFLSPFAYQLLQRTGPIVTLATLGAEQTGYLGIAIFLVTPVYLVPMTLGYMLYTAYSRAFGATESAHEVGKLIALPLRFVSCICALLVGYAVLLAHLPLRYYLPKYLPGLQPTYILLASAYLISVYYVVANYFASIGRQRFGLIVQLFTVAVAFAACFGAVKAGYGLVGVAAAIATCNAGYALVMIVAALRFAGSNPATIAVRLLVALAPGLWVALGVWLVHQLPLGGGALGPDIVSAIVRVLALTGWGIPLLVISYRALGPLKRLRHDPAAVASGASAGDGGDEAGGAAGEVGSTRGDSDEP